MTLPFGTGHNLTAEANIVFQRALDTRFKFAVWMFKQAGFKESQARVRGRMIVVYMMGESTLISDTPAKRKKQLKIEVRNPD